MPSGTTSQTLAEHHRHPDWPGTCSSASLPVGCNDEGDIPHCPQGPHCSPNPLSHGQRGEEEPCTLSVLNNDGAFNTP